MSKYDVAVIGGGPGGYVAAIRAAQLGGKVALIEEREVGGTCLNRGCIPTKALLASSELLSKIRGSEEFGIKVERVSFDISKIFARKDAAVERLVKGVEFILQKRKVDLIRGRGKILSAGSVEVTRDGQKEIIETSNIIIATGSEPALIPVFNIDRKNVITSDEALELEHIPKTLLIVGSGAIGSEFACFFKALGVDVIVVEMLHQMLPTEDSEIARRLQLEFKKRKIKVVTGDGIKSVNIEGKGKVISTLSSGKSYETEMVLVAIGRSLNNKEIGLEEVGVKTERGKILVDDRMETNVPGIYAIGDVVGGIMLAHVASREGIVAVNNCIGRPSRIDYRVVPACIYTQPEVASIGLRETSELGQTAKKEGYEIKVGKFPFSASGKAVCIGEPIGFVKIIADAKINKVLGVHIIGPHVTDLIGEVALAMQGGMPVEEIANTIHAHPTLCETIMEAAEGVDNLAIHTI